MTASRRRFSQEFKDELCQEVIATSKPIKEVAVAYGVGPETLRNWLIKYRDAHGGTETELTAPDGLSASVQAFGGEVVPEGQDSGA